ncbi:MAG: hypothetical protein K2X77_02170 [Candidatus Obscuribacterales bacterium]|jgi:hypothetical protein|nr:hypothetical protein [Candidatus Obscuribacterales bacterium]
MRFFGSKHRIATACSTFLSLTLSLAAAQAQMIPSFEDYGKGDPHILPPDGRMVVMSDTLALITAQRYALPANTWTYPMVGLTMFPYYQASPQLKTFLNANRVAGIPITHGVVTPRVGPFSLPPTDLIRLSIPIPQRRETKHTRLAQRGGLTDEVPWHVAHQGGQAFTVPGDTEALVLASSGTMFNACGPLLMGLRCGTLWVFTGARPVSVLTKYGAVKVKPYSIAAVEQTWFNRVRVGDLYGAPVDVHLSYKGKDAEFSIEKGKEYSFSESKTASVGTTDMIATRTPVTPASAIPELNTSSRAIDPDASNLMTELKTVHPPFTTVRMTALFERMMKERGVTIAMRKDSARKLLSGKDDVTSKPSTYKASLDAKYFVPVYKPVRNVGAVPFPRVDGGLNTKWMANGYAKYLSDSKFAIDEDGRVTLDSGEAVFEAKNHMRVRAGEVVVDFQPGSILYVNAKKDVVVVRNLKEKLDKNVILRVGGRSIKCAAGEELVVGNELPHVMTEMKNDGVSRRNVRAIEALGANILINKSEFSLTAFMQYSPIMRALYASKDEGDKQLLADVIKMDAVLSLVTGKRGSYQRMSGLPSHGL